MMTLSHAIINGSLNRTTHPERSVAAYAVSNSLQVLSESPMVMLRQTGAALVRDRAAWRVYARVALRAILLDQLICLAIAWTPLSHLVFHYWLGVKDELFPATVDVFRVHLWVALFSMLRSVFHTVLLVKQKTLWVTLGMGLRLALMLALAALFTQTGWLDSGVRGAVIFLAGMAMEALAGLGAFRKWFRSLPERLAHPTAGARPPVVTADDGSSIAPEATGLPDYHPASPSRGPLTTERVARFYLPLVIAALTSAMGPAIVNSGLSRMADPQSVIATAAIANVVGFLVMGPLFMLHQVSLFFAPPLLSAARSNDPRDRTVKWFCANVGLGASVLLGLLAWTPGGDWLLAWPFQAPLSLLPQIKAVLRLSMFLPLISVWNEFRNGKLLATGRSAVLTLSKLCNIAVLAAAVMTLVRLVPELGARVSPLAVLCALGAEQTLLWAASARLRRTGL